MGLKIILLEDTKGPSTCNIKTQTITIICTKDHPIRYVFIFAYHIFKPNYIIMVLRLGISNNKNNNISLCRNQQTVHGLVHVYEKKGGNGSIIIPPP